MLQGQRLPRGQRTPEEEADLKALIIKRFTADPDLAPRTIALRLKCSCYLVRVVLREAGLIAESGHFKGARR